ncbi:tyrosine-protein phosphatase [Mucilaginibacter sp. SG564]|uniref:tyrosine-protein phosphatase n=1 Tax=unclassified Mucilaginibacter TaxID=2617802 RepID=UPI001556B737|nr:CpsB/CapC family capsule biosynthesis tyrosine phosphatase [Mucilaginibacter sp. SG564]NOW96717.1 tyrosine-protein phosphatase YwqE [Mucilaginibacter sp. SG564]
MFGLFKKKPEKRHTNFNYDSIMVDMHSHVLPGIDDGAKTPQDSVILIRKMMDLGIKKVIATPHIMVDFYRNTPETINNALNILKAELVKENIDIPVEAAAEHYFDETFETRVDEGKLLTMGDNYALFEFSFINKPPNAITVIQKMNDMGYKPILAHPERYPYMDLEQFKNLHTWGCNFQLNTISLTGYYGRESKKMAESLIDNELIDFISSDMHHTKHAAALKDALRTTYIEKLLFDYPLKNTLLL